MGNRIRIVCDGGPLAQITDAATEARIPGVQGVTIEMVAGQFPLATLVSRVPSVDVIAEVTRPIPDTEEFVQRLDQLGTALHLMYLYAKDHYGREVDGPLQDAATIVTGLLFSLTPPPRKE